MEYKILEEQGFGGPSTTPLVIYTEETPVKKAVCSPESRALQQSKNEIDFFYQEGKWDDYKKITNPYEYIFLSWNRRSSRSVATRQPLSRSYFKMIELWKHLELNTFLKGLVEKDGGLLTAHAAEGPGGFIEACAVHCETQRWSFESAFAITLRSDAKNVPGWKKAAKFMSMNPNIHLHNGSDGTGNILHIENQEAFVNDVRAAHPNGVHLFTADGGFDFSNDFNAQEDAVIPLLLAETILGLRVLAKGGCLIIKCFDTVEHPTLHLIWLITRAFCTWSVIKPRTSRAGNAERYIVGKGFLGAVDDILAVLTMYQSLSNYTRPILQPSTCDAWKTMMGQLALLQERIEHVEIAVIRDTLDLIKVTDSALIRRLVRENVRRSIEWCTEHDEPIASIWVTDQERHVIRETADLIHILNPPINTISYPPTASLHMRSTINAHLSFEGFRSGKLLLPAAPAASHRSLTNRIFMSPKDSR